MRYSLRSVILFCIVLSSSSIAQSVMTYERQYNLMVPTWHASNGADYIGAGKAGIAQAGISSAALINPAGLRAEEMSLDIGSWWRPSATNSADFSFTQAMPLPSLLAFSMPLESFGFQLGVARTYDEKITSPEIPLTTAENPEGGIGTIRLITVGSVHTAFAAFSWSPHQDLSVGMTAGVDHLDFKTTFGTTRIKMIGTGWRVIGGALVHVTPSTDVGFAVRYTAPVDLALTTNFPLLRVDPGVGRNDQRLYQPSYGARVPIEFEIGTSVLPLPWLTAMVSVQRQVWSMAVSPSNDVWQFRAGVEAKPLHELVLRLGTYSQKEPGYGRNSYLDQQFLTCGMSLDVTASFRLSLAFFSSEPFVRPYPQLGYTSAEESFHRSEFVAGISVSL